MRNLDGVVFSVFMRGGGARYAWPHSPHSGLTSA